MEQNRDSEVLARKYRPKTFDKLIGQEAISQTLSLALDKNRLSHAYLFSGLRGSGKTSSARIFSKSLLCDNGPTSTPCGVCQNCIMADENRHIDIIELDGASNRKIDDVRDLIEQSKYRPSIGRFKIFIIDEVHMLTKEAFNALLKTLEEPPLYIKFILATTDPLKLPATILSRTQHFKFKKISLKDVIHHLIYILNRENIQYDDDALDIIARSGNGSLRDTLTLLDQSIIFCKSHITSSSISSMLGLIDPKRVDEIFKTIINQNSSSFTNIIDELLAYDTESILDGFISYLKNKMLNNSNEFSAIYYERFFRVLSDSKKLLSLNSDEEFVLILTFMKLKEATSIEDIDEVIKKLECNIASNPINKTQPKKIEKNKFEILIDKITLINSELGVCFRNSIEFVSFENSTLSWKSSADEKCKDLLKINYSKIKNEVKTIFGVNTQIKLISQKVQSQPKKESSNIEQNSQPTQIVEEKKKSFVESDFVQTAIKSLKAKQVIISR
jgi:DNA polymerase-3 subunit gamma/tau